MITSNDHTSTITHKEVIELIAYDRITGSFTWKIDASSHRRAGSSAGYYHNGYLLIKIKGVLYQAHRIAWFYVTGFWPANTIDHRDRNRSNNAFDNLREATMLDQSANKSKRKSKSGFRGVYKIGNNNRISKQWAARIQYNGKVRYLGYFDNPEDAAKVRDLEARKIFGEFYSGDPSLTVVPPPL